MATYTVEFVAASGSLFEARVFAEGSQVALHLDVECTELTDDDLRGHYQFTFTGTYDGFYDVTVKVQGGAAEDVEIFGKLLLDSAGGTYRFLDAAEAVRLLLAAIADLVPVSGDKQIDITVVDGSSTELANATVSIFSNEILIAREITDVNGEVSFNLSDGTYAVTITLFGYSFTGATLAVSANADVTYTMSAVSVPIPADPAFCTLAIRCWGTDGAVANGVDVKVQVTSPPDGEGEQFDDSIMTDTSGVDGYATFTVPRGCSVRYWVGRLVERIDDVGDDAVVYVDNFVGHDT